MNEASVVGAAATEVLKLSLPGMAVTVEDVKAIFTNFNDIQCQKVIGFISLNYIDDNTRNLGYCIHTSYQGRGYAKEDVEEVKKYAKEELELYMLISGTAEENEPSIHLLTSAGFTITGKQQGSFVNDENGNPIVFMGCSFECKL